MTDSEELSHTNPSSEQLPPSPTLKSEEISNEVSSANLLGDDNIDSIPPTTPQQETTQQEINNLPQNTSTDNNIIINKQENQENMMIDEIPSQMNNTSEHQLLKRLKQYEINAYSSVVTAFRAQGEITWEKVKLLTQLQQILHISTKRHSAELLRAESDTKIQQVAQSGVVSSMENEDKQTQFDFILNVSETESEPEIDNTKQKKSGRGRGRGKKRSAGSTSINSLPEQSPSKIVNLTPTINTTTTVTNASTLTTTPTATTSSTTTPTTNGKKKRGRKPKKQTPDVSSILGDVALLTDEDIDRVNTVDELEKIAERESEQIEHLEEKLSRATNEQDKHIIMISIIYFFI
ncbi:hypothetical protein ABK040_007457 [Willaertia magna]